MAPKRKAPRSDAKAKPSSKSDGKRKAAAAPAARQVRRKVEKPAIEALPEVHHPSHGTVPGTVFVFGEGDCGQLGLGEDITEKYRPAPLDVDGKKVLQVRPGGMHTVAVTEDGSVYSWGVNDEGALGRETTGELWEKSPLATGKPTDSYVPGRVAFPAGAPPIVQLSAGDSHTCALGKDGSVWAWGTYRDGSGVLGFSPGVRFQLLPVCVHKPSSHAEQVVRISSGADHVAAVTAGGALLTWGNHHQGMLGRVGARLSDRVKMSTLLHPHPVPFKHKASAKATKIVDAVCGTYSTFAVAADGTIYAFGLNNYGQLALTGANPVWAPTQVTALKGLNVVAVSGGEHHSLARTSDGKLYSFGRPTYGRLGRKDVNVEQDDALPEVKPVDGLDGVTVASAAAGQSVSGCIDAEGSPYVWGMGTTNQLAKGEDDDSDEALPKKIAQTKAFNNQRVLQLEFGGQHVAMLCQAK